MSRQSLGVLLVFMSVSAAAGNASSMLQASSVGMAVFHGIGVVCCLVVGCIGFVAWRSKE